MNNVSTTCLIVSAKKNINAKKDGDTKIKKKVYRKREETASEREREKERVSDRERDRQRDRERVCVRDVKCRNFRRDSSQLSG